MRIPELNLETTKLNAAMSTAIEEDFYFRLSQVFNSSKNRSSLPPTREKGGPQAFLARGSIYTQKSVCCQAIFNKKVNIFPKE
jgi:hypothetical protein